MDKWFNSSAFRFILGFLGILALAFAVIVVASHAAAGT